MLNYFANSGSFRAQSKQWVATQVAFSYKSLKLAGEVETKYISFSTLGLLIALVTERLCLCYLKTTDIQGYDFIIAVTTEK